MGRSSKLKIASRPDGQRGLFVSQPIRKGEVLIEYDGPRIPHATRYSLQIDDDLHIEGREETNAFLNHACAPTAYNDFAQAPERVVLRAIRDLSEGEEVTVDYNAYDFELFEPFRCSCGAPNCYREVRGFRYLSETEKERLSQFLPPHLRKLLAGAKTLRA